MGAILVAHSPTSGSGMDRIVRLRHTQRDKEPDEAITGSRPYQDYKIGRYKHSEVAKYREFPDFILV